MGQFQFIFGDGLQFASNDELLDHLSREMYRRGIVESFIEAHSSSASIGTLPA